MPPLESMPIPHRRAIEEAIESIEKRSGSKIPEGSNPAVTPIMLTIDDVHIAFRPFLWYIFISVSHTLARQFLEQNSGVEFGVHGDLEYMVRIPKGWDPQNPKTRPIVFLHGLGFGLLHYSMLIAGLLRRFSDRPLLVPIQPHISQRIFHGTFVRPLGRHATVEGVVGTMRKYGFVPDEEGNYGSTIGDSTAGVTMLSHSKSVGYF